MTNKQKVIKSVETELPEFSKAVALAKEKRYEMIMHQDAFATKFSIKELCLLGMAVKYAGIHDVKVLIISGSK